MQPLKPAAHSEKEGVMGIEQELSNALESALGDSSDSNRNAGQVDRERLGQEDQRTQDNQETLATVQAGCTSACPTVVMKGGGTDGKHLSERGTIAGWLTAWHFSLSDAGFGPESPVFLAWLITSLGPNFQLEISQSERL